jgi:hypothetical protein
MARTEVGTTNVTGAYRGDELENADVPDEEAGRPSPKHEVATSRFEATTIDIAIPTCMSTRTDLMVLIGLEREPWNAKAKTRFSQRT